MPAAVAAVAAFVIANAGTIALAVSIASIGFALYSAKKLRTSTGIGQSERKQTLRSSTAPKTFLYGENISAGVLLFAEEQAGDQTDAEKLHLVISHAGTPIDRVTDVFINEEPSDQFSEYITVGHYPQGRVTADPYLIANAPSWESDMVGRNFAWVRASLTFNADAFPSGVPNLTFRKFGRRVLDPRNTNAAAYSSNVALCMLDYLRNHPSLQYTDEELLLDTFMTGANICDEIVNVYDSVDAVVGTEARYTLSVEVDFNEDPSDVIDSMLVACGGEIVRVGGRLGLHVGAYYGPTTLTLTQDDIVGAITIQPEAARQDSYNVVRGVYNSKENNFTETDYPEVRFSDWITEDGTTIVENIDMKFVNSPSQAQRIADLHARRARFGMIMEIPCNYRGFNYPPGTSLNLTLSQIALLPTEFKVLAWTHSAEGGVTLIVRRENASYYNQQLGHNIVLPPLVNIPSNGVIAPSSVQFVTTIVGEVVQGQITWVNGSFKLRSIEAVVYSLADANNPLIVQTASIPFPGALIDLNGKLAGNYRVDLFSVSITGSKSTVSSLAFTIAAPIIPDSASVRASNWNIQLVPNYDAGTVPPNTLFEFRYLADSASFATGTPNFDATDINQSELLFTGSTFNHGGLIPDRYQHYWIRGVNAYGQSGYLYVVTGTTKDGGLVTTVVERLEAVEIVSSNYVEGESGYKLFGPNPDAPEENGRAELNDIIARGTIRATDGEIINRLTVGSGYIDGRNDSNEDFLNVNGRARITHNGDFIGVGGSFSGTVFANRISGNLTSSQAKTFSNAIFTSIDTFVTIASWSVSASSTGLSRTIISPSMIIRLETTSNLVSNGTFRIICNGVQLYQGRDYVVSDTVQMLEVIIPPAGFSLGTSAGTISIQVSVDTGGLHWRRLPQTVAATLSVTGGEFN